MKTTTKYPPTTWAVALALLFCSFSTIAQNRDSIWFQNNYTKTEYQIPMRDGIKLWTVVFTPKDASITHPFLMMRTPYACAPYGKDIFPARVRYAQLMREGYIFVQQDVRGRWMSEGEYEDVRPHNPNKKGKEFDEASDTYDTAEWLLANIPNHNGRIGVLGISYPGFYATMATLADHPAIKAVSPQAPVTDWFIGDDFHHNGALMLMDAFNFYSGFGLPRPKPTTVGPEDFDYKMADAYQFFQKVGTVKNIKTKYFGDSLRFWNDLMKHPNYDAFWKARNPRPHLKNTMPAVMTVGGLFDAEDCFGALRTYEAFEKQNPPTHPNYLVMGPWSHGGWERGDGSFLGNISFESKTAEFYRENIQLKFFEFYLKDKGAHELPEASIFETGSNQWKQFASWPPKEAVATSFFLSDKNVISTSKPAVANSFDEYVSDPAHPVPYTKDVQLYRNNEYMTDDQRFAARRPDVLVYQTEAMNEDLSIAGPINVDFYVSTTGTDADFVVKIIDVFPDDAKNWKRADAPMAGYQMLLRGEPMRGKFRDSYETPVPFKPGNITRLKFQMPDIAHTFKKGHRMMIQIQSSWFPLVDLNPQKFVNIYEATESDFQKATHRIYHDATHASRVEIGVVK
ncbi:MAG: CocE/NonD family hydrolase [Saprospiraceae bacterium]